MTNGFTQRPLCPFCSKPWTDGMIQLLDVSSSGGCDTCGYGGQVDGSIKIECSSCEKLIYEKHFSNA